MSSPTTRPSAAPGGRGASESAPRRPSGRGEQLRQEKDRSQRLQSRRLANFQAQKLLRTFSTLDRVKKCRCVRAGQTGVEIVVRGNGRAHFSNLQTCGSVWSCPSCSEKILAVRATELQTAIRTHWSRRGSVVFLTLTMRHRQGQKLADLWPALTGAWRAATGGSRSTRAHWADLPWVKRVEATVGPNGWHLHVHALLFAPEGGIEDLDGLADATFAAWSRSLQGAGLEAPERGPGLSVKRLSLAGMRHEIAQYLAKGTYTGAEALNERAAALEIASSSKQARGRNRTPFQVLADFVRAGEASDAEIWREWEAASFRRRAMTWARGCRDDLVATIELDDDQAAVDSDGEGEVVAVIDPAAWPAIAADPVLCQRLLATVELIGDRHEPHLVVDAILSHAGHLGAVGPPPSVSESGE